MRLNLKHRFPVRDNSNRRFWYMACAGRLLRHVDEYEELVEITPTGETINIIEETKPSTSGYLWNSFQHNIMCVNRETDDWYDLVYHFLWCDGFKGLYINASKDVCIEIHVAILNRIGYYTVRYMTWIIELRGNWLNFNEIIRTDVSLSGFYCMNSLCRPNLGLTSQELHDDVLEGYTEVISKNNYKTKKMVVDIIEGNTYKIVKKLYDVNVVCCNV